MGKINVENNLVQISESENDCLHRPLFNVNIRLFVDNVLYHKIILDVCDYMNLVMTQEYENYPKLAGLSGANIGIPFNIIALFKNDEVVHMINPSIIKMSKQTRMVRSNCGSLNLKEKVSVARREWIDVSYYDIFGRHNQERFTIADGGATIQHEIDHNKGVLITDTSKHL
jgi:peptide deformylase